MNKTQNVAVLQTKMKECVSVLLDKDNSQESLTHALIQINRIFMEFSDIQGEETPKAKNGGIFLPGGLAISPEFAAMNLRDILRTAKYLRATKESIDYFLEHRDIKRVHLVYAGCGPYGTLVIPLLSLYELHQLKISLIDIQPESLESVQKICNGLGYSDFIDGYIHEDASFYVHPENDPIHILVLECMVHALGREPQVSISMNLSKQLVENGILIPEEIKVSLIAADPEGEFKESDKVRQFLGDVFILDKNCKDLKIVEDEIPYIEAASITLPDDLLPLLPLMFFTEIKLFNDHILQYYESGITHPLVIGQQDAFLSGDVMHFKYRMDSHPGLFYEKVREDPWSLTG